MPSKLTTMKPKLATMDSRTVRPPPKVADEELRSPEHHAWRAQVLRMAGHRCQATEGGKRCTVAAPVRLFADHIIERQDGGALYDVRNGQCLCGRHHTLKTMKARAQRHGLA